MGDNQQLLKTVRNIQLLHGAERESDRQPANIRDSESQGETPWDKRDSERQPETIGDSETHVVTLWNQKRQRKTYSNSMALVETTSSNHKR